METLSRIGSNIGAFYFSLNWVWSVGCTPSTSSFLRWVSDDGSHCSSLLTSMRMYSSMSWTTISWEDVFGAFSSLSGSCPIVQEVVSLTSFSKDSFKSSSWKVSHCAFLANSLTWSWALPTFYKILLINESFCSPDFIRSSEKASKCLWVSAITSEWLMPS